MVTKSDFSHFCTACLCLFDDLLVLDLRLAVADAKQWGLKHIDMPLLDQFGEELKEKVMMSRRICIPSTSASVATITLL